MCANPDADKNIKPYAGREQALFDIILKYSTETLRTVFYEKLIFVYQTLFIPVVIGTIRTAKGISLSFLALHVSSQGRNQISLAKITPRRNKVQHIQVWTQDLQHAATSWLLSW